MKSAILKCMKKFDLLTKMDVITKIESSIREGLKTVVHGKVRSIINHYLIMTIPNQ